MFSTNKGCEGAHSVTLCIKVYSSTKKTNSQITVTLLPVPLSLRIADSDLLQQVPLSPERSKAEEYSILKQ